MRGEMTVEAVVRDIGLSAHEPFGERGFPFKDLRPSLEPVDVRGCKLAPEFLGIFLRAAIEVEVAVHSLDVGFADEIFGGRVAGGAHASDCSKWLARACRYHGDVTPDRRATRLFAGAMLAVFFCS